MTIKKIIVHAWWICWKDLLDFVRSKMSLVMLILMPLFMMMMVGFIYTDSEPMGDTPIALADMDNGTMSDTFIAQLNAINEKSGLMTVSSAEDMNDVKDKIYDGNIDGGIIIPSNFTESILSGGQGTIIIITDQSNPQLSMQIEKIITMIIQEMGTYSAMQNLNITYSIPYDKTLATIKPYIVKVDNLISDNPSYFQFVAPGIMGMVVMMSLMTGLPHAISYEKDTGTLDGMLVAPIHRLSIILGKVMAQTTRGMLQGLIILVLAIVLFGVVIYGNILLVLFIMLLSVFSFVGLGILITSFTDKEETASMIMMTLMFPMMFLGGVFFPIEQMPDYIQKIAQFLPLTYVTTALRKVMNLGVGMANITNEILFLLSFGIVFLFIAVPMFKKAMNK